MSVESFLPEYQGTWDASGHDAEIFFASLLTAGKISYDTYSFEIRLLGKEPPPEEEALIPTVPLGKLTIQKEMGEIIRDYLKIAFHEVIVSLWRWIKETFGEFFQKAWDWTKNKLTDLWQSIKAFFQQLVEAAYSSITKLFESHSPITPEDAPGLAAGLFSLATASGLAAHGFASLTEAGHPYKNLGLQYSAGLLGEMAGWGRISSSTLGVYMTRVLGQAMTYFVQEKHRPVIPQENLLIEFRSKREIDKSEFDKAMAYQGFSQHWTDIIERWQWKDPRTLEIARLADVGIEQGPPPAAEMDWFRRFGVTGDKLKDWWLYRKFMRAGYEDCDLPVLVRFIHRKEVSFALTYVRTAIRRNYRWGYLSEEELKKWMDRLNLPPEAREWIFWAGELDKEYLYRQDLQTYYVTAFRNDLIGPDEFLVSLLAMNLPPREASLLVRTEKIRKKTKAVAPVKKEVAAPLAKLQAAYISLYREQYKKDLIDEQQYLESLLAIGLDPELAEVTVELDATKRVPAIPA